MLPPLSAPTLFPYTTLFRSDRQLAAGQGPMQRGPRDRLGRKLVGILAFASFLPVACVMLARRGYRWLLVNGERPDALGVIHRQRPGEAADRSSNCCCNT